MTARSLPVMLTPKGWALVSHRCMSCPVMVPPGRVRCRFCLRSHTQGDRVYWPDETMRRRAVAVLSVVE